VADVTAETGGVTERYHFLIRRLHSLSGIIPVGVFLGIHLSVNAAIMAGPQAFQFGVNQIHNLGKLGVLEVVEVVFILIPIAFHAIIGIQIWLTSQPNVLAYQYGGGVRYALQRWTGIIALVFILVHLWQMQWLGAPFGGNLFDAEDAARSTVAAMAPWWTTPVYAVGVLCSVYHLANGIWTFLITWGITIGPRSQRLSGYVCLVIGLALGLLGMGSLITLKTMKPSDLTPPAVETHAADAHTAAGDTVL
jgi:succinate dehydrogenase / fumarate reductase cytochrome b subunit